MAGWWIVLACLATSAAEDPGADAIRFLERCRDGKFAEAVVDFDATMAALMPPDKLKETWSAVGGGTDQPVTFGPARVERNGKMLLVRVRCAFPKIPLDAQVSYDTESKIKGLFFRPAKTIETVPYANTTLFSENQLTVGAEGWPLGATFSKPTGEGPFPLVVFVHGSGPNDRDETVGANTPFRDLAQGLASRGIASIRYDKRTRVHGTKMTKGVPTLDEEVVDDALAAIAQGRTLDRIDARRVYVLGHSLGAVMAPRIAQRDGKLAGLIWMAGNVRPIDEVMLDQFRYLSRDEAKPSRALREIARASEAEIAAFRANPDQADGKILGAPFAYWKPLAAVRPDQELAQLPDVPVLALQGGRDYQVTSADFDKLRATLKDRANVVFELYPELNHLFLAGTGPSGPGEYGNPGHVDLRVVERIAAWINAPR